jgi:hypothetical protein
MKRSWAFPATKVSFTGKIGLSADIVVRIGSYDDSETLKSLFTVSFDRPHLKDFHNVGLI